MEPSHKHLSLSRRGCLDPAESSPKTAFPAPTSSAPSRASDSSAKSSSFPKGFSRPGWAMTETAVGPTGSVTMPPDELTRWLPLALVTQP